MKNKRLSFSIFFILASFTNVCQSQNTLVGDGFGGRSWYKPTNLSSYSYGGFITCGPGKKLYGWGYDLPSIIIKNQIPPVNTPLSVHNLTNVKYHSAGYYAGVIKSNDSGYIWSPWADPVGVIRDAFFCDGGMTSLAFIKRDGSVWLTYDSAKTYNVRDVKRINGIDKIKRVATCASPSNVLTLNSDGIIEFIDVGISGNKYEIIKRNRLKLKSIIDIQSTSYSAAALDKDGNVFVFDYSSKYPDSTTAITKINLPYPAVAISGKCDGYEFLYLCENGYCYRSTIWTPMRFGGLTFIDSNVIDIAAGEEHDYYITSDKKIKQRLYSLIPIKASIDSSCIQVADTIGRLKYSDTINLYSCTSSLLYKGKTYSKDTQLIERYQTSGGWDSTINIFIRTYSLPVQFIDKTFVKCSDEEFTYQNIIFKTQGVYQDTFRTIRGCDSVIRKFTVLDSICDLRIYIPDVFTPNPEGPIVNNTFQPSVLNFRSFQMEIFNRWGEKLYETTDVNAGWDGSCRGKMSPGGIYVYKIVISSKENKTTRYKGTFTLLR